MKSVLIGLGVLALLGTAGMAVFVYVVQNVEQPRYASVLKEPPFELRDYPPLVVAEVRCEGSRRRALREGFGPLARYIFAKERGEGGEGERIAMTAPVVQQPRKGSVQEPGEGAGVAPDEPIAMTAPVIQMPARASSETAAAGGSEGNAAPGGADDARAWSVGFIMPSEYSLDELPAPAGDAVRLSALPARRMAAVRFSGTWGEERVAAQERDLREWMAENALLPASPPVYAYYNDPFTPPFLRRNEVMIEVIRPGAEADLRQAGRASRGCGAADGATGAVSSGGLGS